MFIQIFSINRVVVMYVKIAGVGVGSGGVFLEVREVQNKTIFTETPSFLAGNFIVIYIK